jgi:peroxiredoxin Q/BCP
LPTTPSALLPAGQPAPDFRLLDQQGRSLGLSDGMGERGLVLLFYSSFWLPRDLNLLKSYGQAHAALEQAGLGLMAISGINWETQHHLAERIQSPFPMLFDPCCRISKYYGAMMIPKFVTGRAVYGLNPQGQVVFASKNASPQETLRAFSPFR